MDERQSECRKRKMCHKRGTEAKKEGELLSYKALFKNLRRLGLVVDALAHVVEVHPGVLKAREVVAAVVLETVLGEQLLDARRHLGVAELRHPREQVVLNLVVKVRHEPVHPLAVARVDVRGVHRRVFHLQKER